MRVMIIIIAVLGGCGGSAAEPVGDVANGAADPAPAPVPAAVPAASGHASGGAMSAEPAQLHLYVEGITCEGCASQIREALQVVEGVSGVETSVEDKTVLVVFDPRRVGSDRILQVLSNLGYRAVRR